ncbi:MAG TPA: tetratricopeptide repeat protein [Anaerolineae bacterium]|nr:tetratricopeptide repeat protein [Anaerolineae bacterium]
MNKSVSNRTHWREVFRQQSLVNAEHWLDIVEKKGDVASLVATDYENLLRAVEIALNDPKIFDLAYRLIRALFSVVYGYGDWERWLVYLEQALAISQQTNRSLEEAFLFEYRGDLLFPTGKLQEAEASFQQAGNQFNHLQRIGDFSRILAKLALIFDLRGETTQGIDLCQHALSLAQAEKNLQGIAHANLTLSHIYGRARKWEKALNSAQKSYDIYQSLQESEFSNKALMNIVAYWAELGKWDKVHNMPETLMEPLIKIGDVRTLSQLKNNLGVVAFNQGNYKTAETFWQGALHLHSQIQEPTELAGLYNNLGVLYTALGEWTAAKEMLQKAISAYNELGDVYNWANALDNLADLYEVQGNTAVIPRILEEAIAGLQVIDRTLHTQKLLTSMQIRLKNLHQNK